MSSLVRAEREALTTLLTTLGPQAATLCSGWTTADLAAHLVARERRADSLPGLLVPVLAGHTERVRLGYRDLDYGKLLDLLRQPPWWALTAAIEAFDLAEWFVHHEDVRRANPDRRPRRLSRPLGEALWAKLFLARALLRRTGYAVTLQAPGFGRRTVGSGRPRATVTGEPGEILLFCFGCQAHARVEVEGVNAGKLRRARLGLLSRRARRRYFYFARRAPRCYFALRAQCRYFALRAKVNHPSPRQNQHSSLTTPTTILPSFTRAACRSRSPEPEQVRHRVRRVWGSALDTRLSLALRPGPAATARRRPGW